MKKLLILSCLSLLVFTDLSAETVKRFHIGFDVGGCPITPDVNGYRFGGGIGVQVSKRVGFIAEFGYAFNTSNRVRHYRQPENMTTTFSSVPLSGSIVLITPVTEGFSAHIGLGLGYYLMKIRDEYFYNDTSSGYETKSQGLAPHVSLGFEAEVIKRITIYASVKEIIGKSEWYDRYEGETNDIHFS